MNQCFSPTYILQQTLFQVYIAEADGITEYSTTFSLGTRLVAIKFLGDSATEKEK